jgi:hypothetical protein
MHWCIPAILALLLHGIFRPADPAHGQGCVTARGAAMPCSHQGVHAGEALPPASGFQASVAYRWLHSDRNFVGDDEQEDVERLGAQPINDSHFIDVALTYSFTPRFSTTLVVPFVAHQRSQAVLDPQTLGFKRFTTHASGLADVRLTFNGWVLDPSTRAGNLLLGVGIDMPTGEKDVRDTFLAVDFDSGQLVPEGRPVDQSIQPGDGGWGLIFELYAYRELFGRLNGYVNGAYTITPEEKSGVPTFSINPFESDMSIADSYLGRSGIDFAAWPRYSLVVSLGARIEGVSVGDVINTGEGFRRPGYAVSIEPGVTLPWSDWLFSLYTPVALYRNRLQSVAEKQFSNAIGADVHGDASFADFLISFTLTRRFN